MSDPGNQADTAAAPALDSQILGDLRRLQDEYANPQFLQQLIQIFRTNAPRRMEQIRAAIAAGDSRLLEHTAHTLKSNCSMLGASRMAAHCLDLEGHGEHAQFDAARTVMALAEIEFQLVMEELDALQAGDRPAQ